MIDDSLQRSVGIAMIVVLVGLLAGGGSAAAAPSPITETVVYDTGGEGPGAATLRYTIPGQVSELTVKVHGQRELQAGNGFDRVEQGFKWDGVTRAPTLRYRPQDPSASEYQVIRPPLTYLQYRYAHQDPGIVQESRCRDDEVIVHGRESAVSGAAWVARPTPNVSLVVPRQLSAARVEAAIHAVEAATVHQPPAIGDRNQATVITDPEVDGAYAAPPFSDRTYGIVSNQYAITREATMAHELTHVTQPPKTATSTEWLIEGTATFYGSRVEANRTGEAYATRAGRGGRDEWVPSDMRETDLTRPGEWQDSTRLEYGYAGYQVALINAELAGATNGTVTVDDLMQEWQRQAPDFTHDDLITWIEAETNQTVAARIDRWVKGQPPVIMEYEQPLYPTVEKAQATPS